MRRLVVAALSLAIAPLAAAGPGARALPLTAAQIVAKNVAARGGLEAWRGIETMVWMGHVESTRAPVPIMPFVLEQKRPNKTRFELESMSQRTLRVFDGSRGWKQRAGGDGRPELRPYTPQELRYAAQAQGIDGPLIAAALHGDAVTVEGTEHLGGHRAYRLAVQRSGAEPRHIWVDAHTFLEVKYDRRAQGPAGQASTISVAYRDYRTVEGRKFPFIIETTAGADQAPDRMVIEQIALNQPLDDRLFAVPRTSRTHRSAPLASRSAPP